MDPRRAERVAETIREELAGIIGYEMSDPRLAGILVTGVEISRDSRRAEVRVQADEKDPRRVTLTSHLRLERTRIEPADFDAYRTFHEEVSKHWRVWVNLTPTRDAADFTLLRAWLFFAPADRVTASVLARLYQENDRLEEARLVLRLARAFHPQEAKLWEQSVKVAASPAEEEAIYREMVARFPAEPKYALALGEVRVGRGDAAGARAVLAPLADKGLANVRGAAHYQLARAATLTKQPAVALKHLEQARDLGAESAGTVAGWNFQGEIHERLGQVEEAARAYRQALKLDANSPGPRAALVRLALAAGRKDEALDDLRRYTLAVGDDPAGLVQAASWHLELGRFDDALDLASRAQKQRFDAQAQRVLGLVHLHRGDHQQAVKHLEKADRDGRVLLGLIRAYLALGRVQQAIDSAESAVAVAGPQRGCQPAAGSQPGREALRRAREEVLALAERRKGLLRELKVAPAKAYPWAVAVDAFLAADHAHRAGGPRQRVEALLAGAFGAGVDFGPAYALRGELALERGQLGKALADAQRAVTLSPAEARGYYVRGRVRLERLDRDALADLSRAAELSRRGDGVILHWLAAAQFQSGLRAQALATQGEAVKLRPHDPELAEQLRAFRKAAVN